MPMREPMGEAGLGGRPYERGQWSATTTNTCMMMSGTLKKAYDLHPGGEGELATLGVASSSSSSNSSSSSRFGNSRFGNSSSRSKVRSLGSVSSMQHMNERRRRSVLWSVKRAFDRPMRSTGAG